MNGFVLGEFTPKVLLHNPAMLGQYPVPTLYVGITAGVDPPLLPLAGLPKVFGDGVEP